MDEALDIILFIFLPGVNKKAQASNHGFYQDRSEVS